MDHSGVTKEKKKRDCFLKICFERNFSDANMLYLHKDPHVSYTSPPFRILFRLLVASRVNENQSRAMMPTSCPKSALITPQGGSVQPLQPSCVNPSTYFTFPMHRCQVGSPGILFSDSLSNSERACTPCPHTGFRLLQRSILSPQIQGWCAHIHTVPKQED